MSRRPRAHLRQVVDQMARRPAVLCGALLLSCLLVLAVKLSYSRAKSVVVAARVPGWFFPTRGPVVDLFLGQQEQADLLCEGTDVCLLFYYAPWCAHSVAAREHIQQVALRLAEQVQFVAVNCWWSQGRCRKQKAFHRYPVVHLYYRRFGPIEYQGPVKSHYVESFIRRVLTPLTYLPSRTAVNTFISHHEQVVIGFFEFNSPQPPAYLTFLLSALHALRRDSQGAVRFGVVTNLEVAEAISLREDETVYLHRRFNSSLVFPRAERNFTPESICDWVYENRESVIHWILPMGTKSYSLEAELHKGPALLLFLPHNPLRANHRLLSEVADVVLRYHSCSWSDLQDEGLFPSMLPHSGSVLSGPACCQSLLLPGWRSPSATANASVCELCLDRSLQTLDTHPSSGATWISKPHHFCFPLQLQAVLDWYTRQVPVLAPPVCSSVQHAYSPLNRYSACCRSQQVSAVQHCPPQADALAGLRCRTNRTLRFYLLDSQLSWPLAQKLGALGNQSASTFSTIVDLGDETHYVLENVGKESLERFIMNFSTPYSTLHRHLVGQRELHPPQSLIQEVTTHTFMDVVMDPERDVLVFYYTGWCGFCTALNHVLLRLALLFQGNSALQVARVNVALNDLPWEFMVDHLPSVLFFPRHRKQMSVKFPENTATTLPNLVRFILQHTSHSPQGHGVGPKSLLEAELRALQGEVLTLQQARERLSKQLTALWHENHRLTLHAHALQSQNAELQSQNAELQAQSGRLHTQYREKSRQLADAVRRLQDLAAASKDLLTENSLLKVLLRVLNQRGGEGERWEEEQRDRTNQETS